MLKIFNSLSKKVEEIVPIHKGEIGMYACGPTVYGFTHIGHGRKYVTDDVLRRTLEIIEELKVKHVQNVTDVGHLISDGDEGEDKMEKGASITGMTVWEVAKEYTEYFNNVMKELNILPPTVICKATEHVDDQIALIVFASGWRCIVGTLVCVLLIAGFFAFLALQDQIIAFFNVPVVNPWFDFTCGALLKIATLTFVIMTLVCVFLVKNNDKCVSSEVKKDDSANA